MEKKVTIKTNFLVPNKSFIYPLFSIDGDKILEEREILTPQKIDEIKKNYGGEIYFFVSEDRGAIPEMHLKLAYDESKNILDEIEKTDKMSSSAFQKAERVVEDLISDLNSAEIEAINLLKDLKSIDEYQYQHQVNVGILSAVFAKKTGAFSEDDIKYITIGAFLIDIGKMKLDKQMLNKKGEYDISDKQIMQRHPQLGYEMLKSIPGINPIVLQTVLFHHERFDNKGYYNLPYDGLPLPPKIASTCDIYDALTSKRPYREAYSPSASLKLMVNTINFRFDYKLVSNFVNFVGSIINNMQPFYSRGDFCELNTQEIAVITAYGEHDELKPKVNIFCKFNKGGNKLEVKFYNNPIEIDLEKDMDRLLTKIINNKQHIDAIKLRLLRKKMLLEYI